MILVLLYTFMFSVVATMAWRFAGGERPLDHGAVRALVALFCGALWPFIILLGVMSLVDGEDV